MAATKINFYTWVLFFLVGIVFSNIDIVSSQCAGPIPRLSVCLPFIKKEGPKIDPSKECCDVIQQVDVLCVCKHLPRDLLPMISPEKTAYVLEKCGKPLPPGTQCGEKTVTSVANPA